MRLLHGQLGYETALVVLLLTPEAYLPLRAVGAEFHASMKGAAAAGRVFEILDTPAGQGRPAQPVVADHHGVGADLRTQEIRLNGVTVTYPGRDRPALDGVNMTIRPGSGSS